jgi:hypothetical protein
LLQRLPQKMAQTLHQPPLPLQLLCRPHAGCHPSSQPGLQQL